MCFSGKVVVVTGASSGIGAATALALAREGAKVALVARNVQILSKVAKLCKQHGNKPLVIKADVSKDEEVKTIVKKAVDQFGQLDILINNAGIGGGARILDDTYLECYDRIMNTNMRSVVLLTHLAAPHLVKTKGNVINISSVSSLSVTGDTFMAYAVSKAALDHFTRCVALDFAQHGVRVNSINPGPVKTSVIENMGNPNPGTFWETLKNKTPLKRIGEPEEIADLILYVASEKARSITGSTLVSDNGILLKSQ